MLEVVGELLYVFVMVFILAFVAVWLGYCNYLYCCFYPSGGSPILCIDSWILNVIVCSIVQCNWCYRRD